MRAIAHWAKTIEGRYAEGGSEISIGGAAVEPSCRSMPSDAATRRALQRAELFSEDVASEDDNGTAYIQARTRHSGGEP